MEIAEVIGMSKGEILLQPIYQFIETKNENVDCVKGSLVKVGEIQHVGKMQAAGLG